MTQVICSQCGAEIEGAGIQHRPPQVATVAERGGDRREDTTSRRPSFVQQQSRPRMAWVDQIEIPRPLDRTHRLRRLRQP